MLQVFFWERIGIKTSISGIKLQSSTSRVSKLKPESERVFEFIEEYFDVIKTTLETFPKTYFDTVEPTNKRKLYILCGILCMYYCFVIIQEKKVVWIF